MGSISTNIWNSNDFALNINYVPIFVSLGNPYYPYGVVLGSTWTIVPYGLHNYPIWLKWLPWLVHMGPLWIVGAKSYGPHVRINLYVAHVGMLPGMFTQERLDCLKSLARQRHSMKLRLCWSIPHIPSRSLCTFWTTLRTFVHDSPQSLVYVSALRASRWRVAYIDNFV